MGGTQGKPQEVRETGHTGVEIILNVYIPSSGAKEGMGMGVYHTGIQIGNIEFAYAGGSVQGSGVYRQQPQDVPPGAQWQFAFSQPLGKSICKTNQDAVKMLNSVANTDRFRGDRYDLLHNNCNHFTEACALVFQVNLNYPSWVNSAAKLGSKFRDDQSRPQMEPPKPNNFAGPGHSMVDASKKKPTKALPPPPSSSGKRADSNTPVSPYGNPWRDPNFKPPTTALPPPPTQQ